MAKGRVGVLERHDAPGSCVPQHSCGRAIAEYLIDRRDARRIGKRLIQMISGNALDAIKRAKIVRDLAKVKVAISTFYDGPLGVGNVVPFAKAHNYGDKLHYEIPMAGDRGAFARHRRKLIRVSARSGMRYAAALPPTTTFASRLLAG
jgi:hypothetical protein